MYPKSPSFLMLFVLLACSDIQPSATSYKKAIQSSPRSQAPDDSLTSEDDFDSDSNSLDSSLGENRAALVAQGKKLWVERGCSAVACHGAIETTNKRSHTADEISQSQDKSYHSTVKPWPTVDEAKALEAALE